MTRDPSTVTSPRGEKTTSAWTAFAVAATVHILFLSSLALGFLDPLFNDATHRGPPGSDFHVVYKAGRNLVRGDSPYRIDPREPPPSWSDYRYLPVSAMTISVLVSRLPPDPARKSWILVNELLLGLAVWISARLAPGRREGLIAASLWLAFSPVYLELFIGQLDLFVAVGFLAAAAAMAGWRPALATGLWIAATLAKWNGLAILPVMLARRRWKGPLVWAALAGSASVTYFLIRPEDFEVLRSTVFRGGFATPHAGNHGFQALVSATLPVFSADAFHDLARWSEDPAVAAYALAGRGILVLVGALAVWATFLGGRRLTPGEGIALWASALAVGWNEFWEHQYVLLLPGLVMLYLEGRRRLALSIWWPLALPTIFVFLDRPHAEVAAAMPSGYDNPDLFILLGTAGNVALHLCKAVPALVLFTAMVLSARGDGSAGRAPGPAA